MPRCRVKRGFFVLRDCDRSTTESCAECSRNACDEHLEVRDGKPLCHDCYGRKAPAEDTAYDDDAWPHRYRHDYYTGHSYGAIYYGSHRDSYYDDYETRSVDKNIADDGLDLDGDDPDGSFFDS